VTARCPETALQIDRGGCHEPIDVTLGSSHVRQCTCPCRVRPAGPNDRPTDPSSGVARRPTPTAARQPRNSTRSVRPLLQQRPHAASERAVRRRVYIYALPRRNVWDCDIGLHCVRPTAQWTRYPHAVARDDNIRRG